MYSKETLIRIVLVSLLLYSALSLFATRSELKQLDGTRRQAQETLAALRDENAQLKESLAQEISEEEMERLARERLGLVRPGEMIFYFSGGED